MNKYISFLGSIVGVLALMGAGCARQSPMSNTQNNPTDNITVTTSAVEATPTTTTKSVTTTPQQSATVKKTTVKPNVTAAMKYTEVMQMYQKSGYRFQFLNCQATPGNMTLKARVKFMLDNRDAETHKIKVGGTSYTVGSYNYVIATAPSTVGTHYVTCDGGGSARINVEK